MCSQSSDLLIKETLKNVCCSYGWRYGILWGFDQRNSLLLTSKDAYYEEQMGPLIDNMLLQVHILGTGIIGQAAFNEDHQWIFSNDYHKRKNSDYSELDCEFAKGIKTIAIISVELLGVVQLGSTQMILERKDFVDRVKKVFRGMYEGQELKSLSPSDSHYVFNGQSTGFLPCFSSLNQNFECGVDLRGFMDANHSSLIQSQLFPSSSDHQNMISLFTEPSMPEYHIQIDGKSTKYELQSSKDFLNTQKCTLLLDSTDCEAQRLSARSPLEDLFQDNYCPVDDLSQWFSPFLNESSASFNNLLNSDQSHATGLILASNLNGKDSPISISENRPSKSRISSVTESLRSTHDIYKKFHCLAVENGHKMPPDLNGTLMPVVNDDEMNFSMDDCVCISNRYVGSKVEIPNSLFSNFGLDHLSDGITSSSSSFSISRFENRSSSAAKRRKIDDYSWRNDQVKIQSLPVFDGNMKSLPVYSNDLANNIKPNTEVSTSKTNSCIVDVSQMNQEEPAKTVKKKKAKPGTRPRPKDRQMIQDHLAELRKLIPNSEKMSIDCLLERTIRYLNFMQSITKQAESLKQIDKAKIGAVLKDNASNGCGVTWACELVDQTAVCPLIVEDLSTFGLMGIEILCEEQNFFLEIVSIIRGFGLTIIKGVMEIRETKIWAHFIVKSEGNHQVTRHEIFSSLIQLLQMTGQSAANPNDNFGNVIIPGTSLFNDCQPAVSVPVNLADTLQCTSL